MLNECIRETQYVLAFIEFEHLQGLSSGTAKALLVILSFTESRSVRLRVHDVCMDNGRFLRNIVDTDFVFPTSFTLQKKIHNNFLPVRSIA